MKLPFETRPAQIVFTTSDTLEGTTYGRLEHTKSCWDTQTGRPVTWTPWARLETYSTGKVRVMFQGGPSHHSRRSSYYPDMSAAQEAVIRWAGRRFRIAEAP